MRQKGEAPEPARLLVFFFVSLFFAPSFVSSFSFVLVFVFSSFWPFSFEFETNLPRRVRGCFLDRAFGNLGGGVPPIGGNVAPTNSRAPVFAFDPDWCSIRRASLHARLPTRHPDHKRLGHPIAQGLCGAPPWAEVAIPTPQKNATEGPHFLAGGQDLGEPGLPKSMSR
jgi:hypothetical protein